MNVSDEACRAARSRGTHHLNRLEQVLARAEWDDRDIAEALMCDVDVDELNDGDGCLLTNGVIGIWPFARVRGRSGARPQPGRITFCIIAASGGALGFPGPP